MSILAMILEDLNSQKSQFAEAVSRPWPRCECGGVAVSNASDDLTRTCIRCGAIVKRKK